MKTSNYKYLAALLMVSLAASNAWADRILIVDTNQTVTLSNALDCYSTPEIRIDTSRPEVYGHEMMQLQAVTDTVRAMLSYECPGLSQINVTGSVRGLEGIVYRGELRAHNDWLVQSLSLASADSAYSGGQTLRQVEPRKTTPPNSRLRHGTLSITDLELGMGIEEVSNIIADTFHIEPQYDATSGLMTMQAGGCPENFNPGRDTGSARTEWKCLKAWFSDKRVPGLDRLELIQVVDADATGVKQRLFEKYGYPDESEITALESKSYFSWFLNNDSDTGDQMIQLDAVLSETGTDQVITSLVLSKPQETEDQLVSFSDVNLQL
jgi:hypothetical protein